MCLHTDVLHKTENVSDNASPNVPTERVIIIIIIVIIIIINFKLRVGFHPMAVALKRHTNKA
jgi:hypothetical protein